MAEFGRGIKAGIVAGIIYGILLGVLFGVVLTALVGTVPTGMENIPGMENISITVGALGAAVLIPMMIVGGIFFGIIFGAIYAAVYGSLPGGTSVKKGIVFSIILWLLTSVGYYGMLALAGTAAIAVFAVLGLISSLIWGALVGVFWDKFGGKSA